MKQRTEDLSKLPKWAQTRIERLERTLAEWKARTEEQTAQEGVTRIQVGLGRLSPTEPPPRYLPDNTSLVFYLEGTRERRFGGLQVRIVRRWTRENPERLVLEVLGTSGAISVLPSSSNVVAIIENETGANT